ncbi:hypothetical protein ACI2JA_03825 [Alkalihalobacillus sp. NPDC078783]
MLFGISGEVTNTADINKASFRDIEGKYIIDFEFHADVETFDNEQQARDFVNGYLGIRKGISAKSREWSLGSLYKTMVQADYNDGIVYTKVKEVDMSNLKVLSLV